MFIPDKIILDATNRYVNNNPWKNTVYEKYYLINPKQKGSAGEDIIANVANQIFNLNVLPRINEGHDRIINNFKTEIKYSLATDRNFDNLFTFNHVGIEKDWERIIFGGVNGDLNTTFVWFTKSEIQKLIKDETFFNRQQGGKKSNNDDYMSTGIKSYNLINHIWAKPMEEFK